jgi:putative transposase
MANQAAYSVQMMCRLLSVSTSGFYAWEDRPASARSRYDLYLTGKIHAIHRRSNGAYGSPMIHAELSDEHGIRVGCKRVARLMRAAHLQGVWPHRFVITTVRDDAAKQPIDLVNRGFYAEYPDRLWVADITYVPTWSGFLYLAAVLDVYSRKVVGWAMENHLRTELCSKRCKVPSLNVDRKT